MTMGSKLLSNHRSLSHLSTQTKLLDDLHACYGASWRSFMSQP